MSYEDGKFESEEDFRTTLGKCLSNLHTRRGWNYMGVKATPRNSRLAHLLA